MATIFRILLIQVDADASEKPSILQGVKIQKMTVI
jgi:hypothetical protein